MTSEDRHLKVVFRSRSIDASTRKQRTSPYIWLSRFFVSNAFSNAWRTLGRLSRMLFASTLFNLSASTPTPQHALTASYSLRCLKYCASLSRARSMLVLSRMSL